MTMIRRMMAAMAAGAMILVQLPMMASADETNETSAAAEAAEIRMAPPAAENRPDFSYMGAVGTLTQEQTVVVANAIYDAVAAKAGYAKYETPIPYSEENKNAIDKIYKTIRYTYREALVCDDWHDHDFKRASQSMEGLFVHYMFPDMMLEEQYAYVCSLFDELEAEADANWTAPEKALYYHELLASYYGYEGDEEGLCYTAYGLLTNGSSVCEGFAWTYNVLMNELGVESYVVTSKNNNHSWNLLKIDGEYYHVDVTWDNTKAGDYLGRIWHESLLRSSPDMVSSGHTHDADDWLTTLDANAYELAARSFRFSDGFWAGSDTRIFPYREGWLVKPKGRTGEFQYYTVAPETLELQYVQTLENESSKWDNYSTNESSFFVENDVVYYTTSGGIMAVAHRPGGGDWDNVWGIWLYSLTPEQQQQGSIYGMTVVDDEMLCMISRGPKKRQFEVYSADMNEFRAVVAEWLNGNGQQPAETTTEPDSTEYAADTEPATEPTTEAPTEPSTEPTTEETTEMTTEVTTEATETTEAPTEPTTEAPAEPSGDLNGDDGIDVVDVIVLTKALMGAEPLQTTESKAAADIVQDGVLDVFDLAMLKWMVLNK